MKNRFRIFGATMLIAIYCFAVSFASNSSISIDKNNHADDTQAQYLASISNVIFAHTSESESSVENLNIFSIPSFKTPDHNLWIIAKSFEQLHEAKFNQYSIASVNFLIQYRKTTLIYPFNYFW